MEEKKTPCDCPLAGFCNRHGIVKTDHYHKLCQNHIGYFRQWEKCSGPGQMFTDCTETKSPKEVEVSRETAAPTPEETKGCPYCGNGRCNGACRNKQALPSKIQMAKNLSKATVEHAKTGFAHATTAEQQARLDICKGCEYYIPEKDSCGKCGCRLKAKSAWKSSKCPENKW